MLTAYSNQRTASFGDVHCKLCAVSCKLFYKLLAVR